MRIAHVAAVWCSDIERIRGFSEKYFAAVANPKYRNQCEPLEPYFLSFGGLVRVQLMHRLDMASCGRDRRVCALRAIMFNQRGI
jgi:hypothetical protein